jgi:thymidylate kinase
MTQLIILMTGEARSGKDTSANLLAEKCKKAGFSVVTTYFAKTLK